jgi:hypothetical protein
LCDLFKDTDNTFDVFGSDFASGCGLLHHVPHKPLFVGFKRCERARLRFILWRVLCPIGHIFINLRSLNKAIGMTPFHLPPFLTVFFKRLVLGAIEAFVADMQEGLTDLIPDLNPRLDNLFAGLKFFDFSDGQFIVGRFPTR